MNWLSERLAANIPQSLIDAGKGTHMNAASAVESAAIQDIPVVFDCCCILPDKIFGQVMDGSFHGMGPSFKHRLSPPVNSIISLDLHKEPARWGQICLELSNLHFIYGPFCFFL